MIEVKAGYDVTGMLERQVESLSVRKSKDTEKTLEITTRLLAAIQSDDAEATLAEADEIVEHIIRFYRIIKAKRIDAWHGTVDTYICHNEVSKAQYQFVHNLREAIRGACAVSA